MGKEASGALDRSREGGACFFLRQFWMRGRRVGMAVVGGVIFISVVLMSLWAFLVEFLPLTPSDIWVESGRPPLRDVFGGQGVGTGFFVSNDGDIITDRHVVANCGAITISGFGFKALPAKVIGFPQDAEVDLALLKADMRAPSVLSFAPEAWADPNHQSLSQAENVMNSAMVDMLGGTGGRGLAIGYYGEQAKSAPSIFPLQFTRAIDTDDQKHFNPVVQGEVWQGESGSPVLVEGRVAGVLFLQIGDPKQRPGTSADWVEKTADGWVTNRGLVTAGPVAAAFARSLGAKLTTSISPAPERAVVRVYCFEQGW